MNIPNLPDSINKIILILSVVVIYLAVDFTYKGHRDVEYSYKEYLNTLDSVKLAELNLAFYKEEMLSKSREVSKKYGVDEFIVETDTSIRFVQVFNKGNNEDTAIDILTPIWTDFLKKSHEVKQLNIVLERRSKEYDRLMSDLDDRNLILGCLFVAGFLAFLVCADRLNLEGKARRQSEQYIIREKGLISVWCQSCGRKFNSIITSGTNSDKSINYSFCTDCFVDGKFTKEDAIAYEDIINDVKTAEIKMSFFNKMIILRRINSLDRWKKDNY